MPVTRAFIVYLCIYRVASQKLEKCDFDIYRARNNNISYCPFDRISNSRSQRRIVERREDSRTSNNRK